MRRISHWWCVIGVWRVSRLLLRMPCVEAVYSRHTRPGFNTFIPGHSDLDATVVLSEHASRNPETIGAVSKRVDKLSRVHFYLSPEDIRFTTQRELAHVTRNYPARLEPLYTPDDWVLLGGREVRVEKPPGFPVEQMPWHPEFNRWWQHVLQDYLLVRRPGFEDRYMRVFYRSALRQQLQFLAALGREPEKPSGFVGDEMVSEAFKDDPEMLDLLGGIKRGDFWVEDPPWLKERILRAVFRSASDFFHKFEARPELNLCTPEYPTHNAIHGEAYERLELRLDVCAHLTSKLKAVISYPIPHYAPYFYNIEMVVPDEVSSEDFSRILRGMDNEFKGRVFYLDGLKYMITYVPEGVLANPLVYLGSPYPFHMEHIQRYGRCLMGEEPPVFKNSWGQGVLVEWCRVFLPYHRITLGRRIEHSCPTINFCQLASIRLFLETGEEETDPEIVRKRHREVFNGESPDDRVWEYVLKDKPDGKGGVEYRAATSFLLKEYDHVEALLMEKIAAGMIQGNFEVPSSEVGK